MFLLHLWVLKGEQTLTTHTVFNTWVTGFKHLFTNLIINQFNVIIGEGQAQTQLVAQHRVWLLVKYVLFKQTPVWAVTHSPRYWVWLDQSEVPFSNVEARGYRTQVGERKCMEDIWKVTVTEDRRQRHGQGVCLPVRIMKLERRVSSPVVAPWLLLFLSQPCPPLQIHFYISLTLAQGHSPVAQREKLQANYGRAVIWTKWCLPQ